MKHDGKLSHRGEVTPLQKTMLGRRSYRKYRDGAVTAAQAAEVDAAARAFCERMGYRAPVIRTTVDPAEFKAIVAAAMAGAIGKTNPWLIFTKASGMIVASCDVAAAPSSGDRVVALAQAAMAMEVAILRAAEMGLGTCWMAGINSREVEKALALPEGRQVIAISTLGHPPEGVSLLSWDGVAYHMISKKRKDLSKTVFTDRL